jgi:microcompartment protein CcmL/EutN
MDMKKYSALGFIETVGLAAAIAAADAALKAANVRLIGREKSKGQGCITVKIAGEVAAVQAAVSAARMAAERVSEVVSTDVIPRPAGGLAEVMVWNDETEGPLNEPDEPFLPAKTSDSPLAPLSEPEITASGEESEATIIPASEPEPVPEPESAEDVPAEISAEGSVQEDIIINTDETTDGDGEHPSEKPDGAEGKKSTPRGKQLRGRKKK